MKVVLKVQWYIRVRFTLYFIVNYFGRQYAVHGHASTDPQAMLVNVNIHQDTMYTVNSTYLAFACPPEIRKALLHLAYCPDDSGGSMQGFPHFSPRLLNLTEAGRLRSRSKDFCLPCFYFMHENPHFLVTETNCPPAFETVFRHCSPQPHGIS